MARVVPQDDRIKQQQPAAWGGRATGGLKLDDGGGKEGENGPFCKGITGSSFAELPEKPVNSGLEAASLAERLLRNFMKSDAENLRSMASLRSPAVKY